MREKAKGNLFRSVLSIALAIVLFLGVALVFAGCDEDDEFYDPENPSASPSFIERYVGGFNTVFANDSSGYGGIDEGEENSDNARPWATFNFRGEFFDALTYFYAYAPNLDSKLSALENFSAFYDSNRVLVYEDEEGLDVCRMSYLDMRHSCVGYGFSIYAIRQTRLFEYVSNH